MNDDGIITLVLNTAFSPNAQRLYTATSEEIHLNLKVYVPRQIIVLLRIISSLHTLHDLLPLPLGIHKVSFTGPVTVRSMLAVAAMVLSPRSAVILFVRSMFMAPVSVLIFFLFLFPVPVSAVAVTITPIVLSVNAVLTVCPLPLIAVLSLRLIVVFSDPLVILLPIFSAALCFGLSAFSCFQIRQKRCKRERESERRRNGVGEHGLAVDEIEIDTT